ncbi:MAG: DNA-binding protein WhiA [Candidatus Riflebacteria bacterium]|nr:DNA-binding protein WhiA [Candidatus Riflebacteria bacterium]
MPPRGPAGARLRLPRALRQTATVDRLARAALPRAVAQDLDRTSLTFGAGLRALAWRRFSRVLADHLRGIRSLHCLRSWLRGMFVRSAYLQDPGRGYHLEFRLRGRHRVRLFRFVARALRLPFRFCRRRDHVVAYLKGRQGLIRFLRAMEAFDRAMAFQDLAATRDLLGTVNRQVNFETANIHRAVSAAERQIERIRQVLEKTEGEPDLLSDALRAVAEARIRFPGDALEALGQRFDPPLSKSAVNHRLRRLADLHRKLFPASKPEAGEPADETE